MLRREILIVVLVVGGLGGDAGSRTALGQITIMPLSEAPDPTQHDDLGPEQPQQVLAPIPAISTPAASIPATTFDPFAGSGYALPPDGYTGGYLSPYPNGTGYSMAQPLDGSGWHWQGFPHGQMYPAYLASGRESRFAGQFFSNRGNGWFLDAALGGRVPILRYGSDDRSRPEGYQLDFEGAAFPRVALNSERQFVSTDFRVGVPWTFRRGPVEGKLAYYHYCSHLGDMYIEDTGATRSPYTRDAVVLGLGLRPKEDLRLYAEADYAFYIFGNAEPWQFQFGIDWSTLQPTGARGAPFFAINSVLRQDVDFGGNMTVQTGWQWRGDAGELLRAGFHYFNGKSNQGQFFNRFEHQIGLGVWYDF